MNGEALSGCEAVNVENFSCPEWVRIGGDLDHCLYYDDEVTFVTYYLSYVVGKGKMVSLILTIVGWVVLIIGGFIAFMTVMTAGR